MSDCRSKKFNEFCFVCGRYVIMPSRRKISLEFAELYKLYFSLDVIRDVEWAPSITCTTCISNLNKWNKGDIQCMPFGVPMIWTDPQVHNSDECYACVNYIFGTNRMKARNLPYKETKFAQLPLLHSENIPIPTKPSPTEEYSPPKFKAIGESTVTMHQPSHLTGQCNHIEITQNRLDIMVRQLKLSQRQSINLAKELRQANILAPDALVCDSIGRHRHFTKFFKLIENNSFAYCTDIRVLVSTMHHEYKPDDWRLFIDSSKNSLKAVLVHITNLKHPVPIALSCNTEEAHLSLKMIIDAVKYSDHQWEICADLKVIALLRGMQTGYTKDKCFLCLWDIHYAGDQYNGKNWPLRDVGLRQNNIVENPLVPIEKIILSPLHMKLGVVKSFIKVLNPEGNAFNELCRIFSRLYAMKIKEGLLNGPDISRLIKDERFEAALSDQELVAWDCVKAVIHNVLGIHRSNDWRIFIGEMLTAFHHINVSMSLKVHFLHCHPDRFNELSPTESDELCERFHQVTATLEYWYSGKKIDTLLGEICWELQKEEDDDI